MAHSGSPGLGDTGEGRQRVWMGLGKKKARVRPNPGFWLAVQESGSLLLSLMAQCALFIDIVHVVGRRRLHFPLGIVAHKAVFLDLDIV